MTPETVVMIPLGAASKEHGPHLKLRNDLDPRRLSDRPRRGYYARRGGAGADLSLLSCFPRVSRLDVADPGHRPRYDGRGSAHPGRVRPASLLRLNTGISTVRALEPAAEATRRRRRPDALHQLSRFDVAIKGIIEQQGGSHADEVETSMMLYIDPSSVDMRKAVRDFNPSIDGARLTRQRGATGTYSPSGIWGDPTRATRHKGRFFVDTIVNGILDDIAALRTAPLPARSRALASPTEAARVEHASGTARQRDPSSGAPRATSARSSGSGLRMQTRGPMQIPSGSVDYGRGAATWSIPMEPSNAVRK